MAIDRFVLVFGLTSSSLNIHELTAVDRYDLDSFPSTLDLEPSSMSLHIIERLGAGSISLAMLADFFVVRGIHMPTMKTQSCAIKV